MILAKFINVIWRESACVMTQAQRGVSQPREQGHRAHLPSDGQSARETEETLHQLCGASGKRASVALAAVITAHLTAACVDLHPTERCAAVAVRGVTD